MRHPYRHTPLDALRQAAVQSGVVKPKIIRILAQLKAEPRDAVTGATRIAAETEIAIPGMHIDWDGGRGDVNRTAPGQRWTLRYDGSDARVLDLVIA